MLDSSFHWGLQHWFMHSSLSSGLWLDRWPHRGVHVHSDRHPSTTAVLRCLCRCAEVNFKEVKLGAIIIKNIRFKVSEVIGNGQMHMIRSQESEYENKRPVCQFPRFLKRETVTATFNSINLLVTETPGNSEASRTLIIARKWHEDESTQSGWLQEQARLKFKYWDYKGKNSYCVTTIFYFSLPLFVASVQP